MCEGTAERATPEHKYDCVFHAEGTMLREEAWHVPLEASAPGGKAGDPRYLSGAAGGLQRPHPLGSHSHRCLLSTRYKASPDVPGVGNTHLTVKTVSIKERKTHHQKSLQTDYF